MARRRGDVTVSYLSTDTPFRLFADLDFRSRLDKGAVSTGADRKGKKRARFLDVGVTVTLDVAESPREIWKLRCSTSANQLSRSSQTETKLDFSLVDTATTFFYTTSVSGTGNLFHFEAYYPPLGTGSPSLLDNGQLPRPSHTVIG